MSADSPSCRPQYDVLPPIGDAPFLGKIGTSPRPLVIDTICLDT
jgi:hypothetical protein